MVPGWDALNNYSNAINGRIWLVWDLNWYTMNFLKESLQFLRCNITDKKGNFDCLVIAFYGFNTVDQRKALWDDFKR